MPGHTRLYRRGAVYYHRAAVPTDIAATYGKREETFSLKTRDYAEAVRRVIPSACAHRSFPLQHIRTASRDRSRSTRCMRRAAGRLTI
ncbi:DUF6538 domain-containing protein [Rhodobacter sp. TJ_12]|uniref:DUF6538 domain-containing protein n=1 Tax=Rhodobacter sp. TJ_12 TaxID=2029399 RepID=UPI0039892218